MTEQFDTGEPAFPSPDVFRLDGTHHAGAFTGMTLRQYAAIHLRHPDSGTEWLDDMIRAAARDQAAEAFGPTVLTEIARGKLTQKGEHVGSLVEHFCAQVSYAMADAMIAARREGQSK